MKNKITFLSVAAFSFFLDRTTKVLAGKLLKNKVVTVVPGLFNLRYAENSGAAFSLLSTGNETLRKLFLIVLPLFIVFAIFSYAFLRKVSKIEAISFGLILGGAVGNLYDRTIYGKVVDFFDFHLGNLHYPTFNVADTCVSLGCVLLVFQHFHTKRKRS